MAPKIDPSSVHLGGDTTQYFAEYLPVNSGDQPPQCILPDLVTLTLPSTPLIPLNADVTPLPPLYNPPNIKFLACETLTVKSDITTSYSARKSYMTLTTTGPDAGEDGAPAACGFALEGLIDIEACETFDSNVNVTFDHAAKGSTLSIQSSDVPNCGFNLIGNIDVNACEKFTAESHISFARAAKGSFINVTPSDVPDCGFILDGIVSVEACETFDANVYINVGGAPVKHSNFDVTAKSFPSCGFTLNGDVEIEACTDFSAEGTINFTGAAVESNTVQLISKSQPHCGLALSGAVDIQACTDFSVIGGITFTGGMVKSNTLQFSPAHQPECGLSITGAVDIEGCSGLDVDGSISITSSRQGVVTGTPISITSHGSPNCGLILAGAIDINACESFDLNVGSTTGGVITVKKPNGETSAVIDLHTTVVVTPGGDGCSQTIHVSQQNDDFTMSNVSVHPGNRAPVTDGCSWTDTGPSPDGLGLALDEDTGILSI